MSHPDPDLVKALAAQLPLLDDDGFRYNRSRLMLHKFAQDLAGAIPLVKFEPQPLVDIDLPDFWFPLFKDIGKYYNASFGVSEGVFSDSYPLGLFHLAKYYDAVIAVARQGLRSAFLAEMAEVPVYILDAHGHGGENKIRWLSNIEVSQLAGKRVLVLEDDVVSGATLNLVATELQKCSPAKIDLLLTNPKEVSNGKAAVLTKFDRIHFLSDVSEGVPHAEAVSIVQTWAWRQVEYQKTDAGQRSLQEEVNNLREKLTLILPSATRLMGKKQRRVFKRAFYRNIYQIISLPLEFKEVAKAARLHLACLNRLLADLENLIELADILPPPGCRSAIIDLVKRVKTSIPQGFNINLAKIIFREKTEAYFDKYLAALTSAEKGDVSSSVAYDEFGALKLIRQVIQEQDFDVVLMVGPEGGRFAAPFEMAGFPIVRIHVDDFNSARPFEIIDDLSVLRGKRVLLLEDDVHSGATLNRTLQQVLPHNPGPLSLFLGNPLQYQTLENVPPQIHKVYTLSPASDLEIESLAAWLLKLAGIFIPTNHSGN
jgi:hypoxanthine phosphoribosyltransferase